MMAKYMPWDSPASVDDVKSYIELCLEKYNAGREFDLALVHKVSEKVIGGCGFDRIDFNHRYAELGYAISREYWGMGIAAEAVRAIMDFGFREMGLCRIEGMCMTENRASARVMEKTGMKSEGVLRKRFFNRGVNHDAFIFSILKKEFCGE